MKTTFRQQMKGFPAWQILIVSIMRFSEPLAFTSLFPYVYFMIRDFHVAKDEASISTYAGILSASFAFTQFLFSVYWGRLSDRVGRKSVLITGLLGTSVCMLIFGFAPNFYVALFARSAMGAVNGNIAVLRTMIGEIATERRHQAVAFSTLPLLWNVGSILGPLIGGSKYFTRPKDYHPTSISTFYEWFLDKYPYALSNIVVSIFLWLGVIAGVLFLEETHPKAKKRRDYGLEAGDWILNRLGYETPVRPWNRRRPRRPLAPVADETSPLIESVEQEETEEESDPQDSLQQYRAANEDAVSIESLDSSEGSIGPISRRMSDALVRRYSSKSLVPNLTTTLSRMSGISMFTDDDDAEETLVSREAFTGPVVKTIIANFLLSSHSIVYSEFLLVLLAGELKPETMKFPLKFQGGYGFSSDSIGRLISIAGMCGACVVLFVFPYLDRHFKAVNNYRFAGIIFPVIYLLLPLYIFTLHDFNPLFPEGLTKKLLYINAGIYQLATGIAFPQIVLLVHRSAPAKNRAFVNATSLSSTALARFIAPTVWGFLMSFFDKIGYGSLTWFVLVGIALMALVQAFTMDEYDEDLKTPAAAAEA